ncbi:histidine phosphatase family protein [Alteromonas sp. KUL49]|uniref:histidine phosphatase family protein n=1 Tax=Alteromonas sp. KUL49 TaxID=2480798 RepID=UPI00102F0326|nr:histidine phosphatase family protein [Alteromonas sp. KUL49]TAP37342.1 histidine phosphatase family protein [Alteromonas sp. KUL49]
MTDIYLVRHGQASFGKANYDKLSDLGVQQAQWLGKYFRERDVVFDALYRGDMVRHQETADGIKEGLDYLPEPTVSSELNEFNFQAVARAYLALHPEDQVAEGAPPADYYRLLKKAMLAWAKNELDTNQLDETWAEFENRTLNMLTTLQSSGARKALVVTSGGAIAMMLKHILGYDAPMVINMNLQIRNASFSQCFANAKGVHLNSFNSVPHLDVIDRLHGITYS